MSRFDEEPDGDPHGECAAEIDRLKALNVELAAALEMLMYVHPIPSTQCSERPAYEKACAALTKHTKESA